MTLTATIFLQALRHLRRRPTLVATAFLTLALGVGLPTAMFAVLQGVFLRGLPFEDGERILNVSVKGIQDTDTTRPLYPHDLVLLREMPQAFDDLIAYQALFSFVTVEGSGTGGFVSAYVTPNFFQFLRVQPRLGRFFVPEEGLPEAPPVAVLGHQLWSDLFARSPDVLGQTILVNRRQVTIVGVAPEGFGFPYRQQLWMPLPMEAEKYRPMEGPPLFAVGRPAAGTSVEVLQQRLAGASPALATEHPEAFEDWRWQVEPYLEAITSTELRSGLNLAFVGVLAVLLVACANLANLLLALLYERKGELAMRSAVGARPASLVAMVTLQALVLAVPGGLAGVGIALVGIRLFNTFSASSSVFQAFWIDVRLETSVLAFCLGLTCAAVLFSAILPAISAARKVDIGRLLNTSTPGSGRRGPGVLSRLMVVIQVAFSFSVLAATGLLLQSTWNLSSVERGYSDEGIGISRLGLYQRDYEDDSERLRTFDAIEQQVASQPEVAGVALASSLPGTGAPTVKLATPSGGEFEAAALTITPGFPQVLNLRRLAGRSFRQTDDASRAPVVLVSRSLAERLGGPTAAIGQQIIEVESNEKAMVIGVVENLAQEGAYGDLTPRAIYYPLHQRPSSRLHMLVRAAGPELGPLLAKFRSWVAAADPYVAVYEIRPLREIQARETWLPRALAAMFGFFAATTLLLSAFGLFGLAAVAVRLRSWEASLRLALGARRSDVRHHFLRKELISLVVGLALGVLLALGAGRLLSSYLYGVAPDDPTVLALVFSAQAAFGLLAVGWPLARLARNSPADILHTA